MGELLTYYLPAALLVLGPLVLLFILECAADLDQDRRRRQRKPPRSAPCPLEADPPG
jgi:hypothetical protein